MEAQKNTYKDTINYLFENLPMYQRVGQTAFKKDLSNIIALCDRLGKPQDKFRSIHIAGTNGKGTTAHILSAIFQASGKKVGLYTSPHYKDFRERIKINGQPIREDQVIEFVQKYKPDFENIKPSFFEITVAMAFEVFAKEEVDIAIIETGLGGRLDSTNIIKPKLSVITNISLDHTQFLGDTLPKIAAEKAGIIKSLTPVIIGEKQEEVFEVFRAKAGKEAASISIASDHFNIVLKETGLDHFIAALYYDDKVLWQNFKIDLKGNFLLKNVITALETIRVWNKQNPRERLGEAQIKEGLANLRKLTNYIGRWHILNKQPLIIGDSAHNKAGLRAFLDEAIKIPHNKLYIIFGMVNDKDPDLVFDLLPKHAIYYYTVAAIPRAMPLERFYEQAEKREQTASFFKTVEAAYKQVIQDAEPEDLVLVCGSIFVLAELL